MPTETLRDVATLYRDADCRRPAYRLVEEFAIRPAAGGQLTGRLWAPLGHRRTTRRRIQVLDGAALVFDTDECHDLGNACWKLDAWLAARAK